MNQIALVFLFWLLLVSSCGYALVKGRKYERIAALIFLTATVLSVASHLSLHIRYLSMDIGETIVDTAVLLSLIAIALVSDRFWPLWVAGLQLVDSMAHLLKAIDLDLPPWAYAIAERSWSYPILIILFVAVWRGQRRDRIAQANSA